MGDKFNVDRHLCRLSAKSVFRLFTFAGVLTANCASASLVYDSSIQLSAQGFGNAPRDLTIQHTGPAAPNDFESGCVGVDSAGDIVVGPAGCQLTDALIDPNGVIPVGGDEPSPLTDNQKYGIPTLASRGITDPSQIGILFNATEPSGNSINVTDITLNFYSPTGTFITSLDGQQAFPNSFAGNGVAGFVFVVDPIEQGVLQSTIFALPDFGSVLLSLNSSLTGATGGPDTFRIVNLSSPPTSGDVPEPATLLLVGLACLIAARRLRRNG